MLDAAGRDVVIIETVGVGQDEVDVVQAAHTVAVVSVPGMGDDIQAIKAGLLEVADLHVVNKADRPDTDRTISELRNMLSLLGAAPAAPGAADPARPSPHDGTGVAELADAFDAHRAWLHDSRRARPPRAPQRRRPRGRRRPGPAAGGARVALRPATRSSAPSRTSSAAASIPAPPARDLIRVVASRRSPTHEHRPHDATRARGAAPSASRRSSRAGRPASWRRSSSAAASPRSTSSPARATRSTASTGPEHVADTNWEDIGLPGRFPYTRGPYPTMYRSRPWTMRQIAGFGTPQETNQRFQYLIAQGQTGISVDFDMPTLMGYDSDDPKSVGEVGREGVAIDVLDDMEALFDGIDLEEISVSMTINPSAWILLAMYVAVARGARAATSTSSPARSRTTSSRSTSRRRSGSTRSRESMRIVRDTITYSAEQLPRYNPINISGYHISEAARADPGGRLHDAPRAPTCAR